MKSKLIKSFIEKVKFDSHGLVPAIAQDYLKSEILMVAYMNKVTLGRTLMTGIMHYFSRSRNKIWKKGEESGNIQQVKGIFIDCDGDCLLFKVRQKGGAACHSGYRSCFYRKLTEKGLKVTGKMVFDPERVYK